MPHCFDVLFFFIDCYQSCVCSRYKGNPFVVGIDLRNEVHDLHANPKWGNGLMMTWGVGASSACSISSLQLEKAQDGNPKTDWAAAATRAGNKVLAENKECCWKMLGVCGCHLNFLLKLVNHAEPICSDGLNDFSGIFSANMCLAFILDIFPWSWQDILIAPRPLVGPVDPSIFPQTQVVMALCFGMELRPMRFLVFIGKNGRGQEAQSSVKCSLKIFEVRSQKLGLCICIITVIKHWSTDILAISSYIPILLIILNTGRYWFDLTV